MAEPMDLQNVSAQDLLNNVNNAIIAITVGGQSYKIGSRQLTRADLHELRAFKQDLEAQIAAENATCLLDNTFVAVFAGR